MRYYEAYIESHNPYEYRETISTKKRIVLAWMKQHPGSRGFLVITERDGTLVCRVPIEQSGHKYRDNKIISTVTPTGRL